MQLQTFVDIPALPAPIGHRDKILLMGSCFAENMGRLLTENKFDCDLNPMGILYNPLSVAQALEEIRLLREYRAKDLFHHREAWHSPLHHGSFSDSDPETVLRKINSRICRANSYLREASWLVLTLGTSWVYESVLSGRVVGNCHKLPEKEFIRRRLPVGEITERLASLLTDLHQLNPGMRGLLTLSPIRHFRDGMVEIERSQATLLLAVDELQRTFPDQVFYFPAYEIVMDELRDYRYYAEDMLHPSAQAVRYIWERFVETCVSPASRQLMEQCQEIQRCLEHRPFRPRSDEYKSFLRKILLRIDQLNQEYPYLDFTNEKKICHIRLNP
ncbi:MAG: GSCFA domain-containing protein [Bacteroides sp.]|nr:GSCFA domain-containing protein [Bacteroides sp.]